MKRLWLETGAELQGHATLGEYNLLWAFSPDDPDSLAGLDLINHLAQVFMPRGLHILGLSTGLESFDQDAEAQTGYFLNDLAQDPQRMLPDFPLMMDHLHQAQDVLPENYLSFLCESIPDFARWPIFEQEALRLKARTYLASKSSWAVTATLNELARIPSWVLFNRYYEVLEDWSGLPDPEEVITRIDYWLSFARSRRASGPSIDPF